MITHSGFTRRAAMRAGIRTVRPGATLGDLVGEGVLHPGFGKLDSAALPFGRPLHVHQEQAIRKVAAGRNVIVATGSDTS